jgi:autotransporter-associated beta strand protein
LFIQHDNAKFSAPIYLDTDSAIYVANAADTMTFGTGWQSGQPAMSGPGNLTKKGPGTLKILGHQTNLLAGAIYVDQGIFALSTTSGVAAVTSPLIIGNNLTNGTTAEVRMLQDNQLPVTVPITIKKSGTLNAYGTLQNAGPITLSGGAITTYTGTLALNADVLATNGTGSIISGNLSLGAAKHAFHLAPGYGVNIQASINDSGGGLDVDGAGILTLSGSNSFSGPLNVKSGVLYARNDHALGAASGPTTVANGARLAIDGRNLGAEPLFLNGDGGDGYGAVSCAKTNTFTGPVTFSSDAVINVVSGGDRLIFAGQVTGPGALNKQGPGTLALSGVLNNNYGGVTTVSEGSLELSKTNYLAVPGALVIGDDVSAAGSHFVHLLFGNQIANNAAVTVNGSGVLDLWPAIGAPETFAALLGSGRVDLGTSMLMVGDNTDTVFNGALTSSASAKFVKEGAGTLSLAGASPGFMGLTVASDGLLLINGSQTAQTIVNAGAKFDGKGATGKISSNGGIVIPGDGAPALQLSSKDLALDSTSRFLVQLNGQQPGVSYTRLNVTGVVNLGNATLNASLGFGGASSNKFVIIANDSNDAVTGTFKGLPEGATLTISGAQFRISYHGGDGNDVELTQMGVAVPPQFTSIQNLGNGQIQLTAIGTGGVSYGVQANAELTSTNWTKIGVALAAQNGGISFTDTNGASFSNRFYRLTVE